MPLLETAIRKRHSSPRRGPFDLDVAFEAGAGITVLMGASGSGKTTLLDCLSGLVTPDAGHLRLDGITLYSGGASQLEQPPRSRRIGYVFQTLALFPHLTARQNVEFGLSALPAAERHSHSQDIMARFHIAHLAEQRPDRISGGERQRVALARSLVTSPRLLLLDEPLSALDLAAKSRILDDLLAWNQVERIPILYVTHALHEAFRLGDHVIVLEQGRIVREGPPAEVLRDDRESLIRQLQRA